MKHEFKRIFPALGTMNSICIYEDKTDILQKAEEQVKLMDDLWSVFKEDSDISKVNRAAGKHPVKVNKETLRLLKAAVFYSELSEGAFDITVQPLVDEWKIGYSDVPPDRDRIEAAMRLVGFRNIIFDDENETVMLKKSGQAVGLGSIAKGYALDIVKFILCEGGIQEAVINFGGSVAIFGEERAVGIQNPLSPTGNAFGSVRIRNRMVVTSGSYEKFYQKNGIRYHHILDPRTGYPADTDLFSVTLIGEAGTALDAVSTAVFVLGMQKGLSLIEKQKMDAVFITNKSEVYATSDLKKSHTLLQGGEK